MNRRHYERLARPGRRRSDRRQPAAEHRRVLLIGTDKAWRLLTGYMFEEAGYAVYAANECQAVMFTLRLLPDVVVIQADAPSTLALVARLAGGATTHDIPVVVLTASLHSPDAHRASAAGAVALLPHTDDIEVLIGEVDTLIAVAPRARRMLTRRLLDLQRLARYYPPNAEGHASLLRLIDHLQVAVLAVDEQGHCIAASEGATLLTGYSRRELRTMPVLPTTFGCDDDVRANGHDERMTTIVTRAGEDMVVHATALAEIMPGVHVAAFAAA